MCRFKTKVLKDSEKSSMASYLELSIYTEYETVYGFNAKRKKLS